MKATKLSPESLIQLVAQNKGDNEKITAPSLSFLEDSWRRLKKE